MRTHSTFEGVSEWFGVPVGPTKTMLRIASMASPAAKANFATDEFPGVDIDAIHYRRGAVRKIVDGNTEYASWQGFVR